jgi:hypothetical protein
MKSTALRHAVIIGSLVSATPSMADAIYDLTATSNVPNVVSNFTIEFDDLNGDGKLSSTSEITSFSGFTDLSGGIFGGNFGFVFTVPDVTGFTNGGGGDNWGFAAAVKFWTTDGYGPERRARRSAR